MGAILFSSRTFPSTSCSAQLLHGFLNGFLCQHINAGNGIDIINNHITFLGQENTGNDLALGV